MWYGQQLMPKNYGLLILVSYLPLAREEMYRVALALLQDSRRRIHYVRTSSIHAGFSIDIIESELSFGPGQIRLNLNPT